MALSIAELKAIASLDTKGFESGAQRVGQTAGNAAASIGQIGKTTTSLLAPLRALGQAIGVAFTVGAIVHFSRAMMTEAAEQKRFASAIGISSGMLKALGGVANRTGADAYGFGHTIAKLTDTQEEAAKGNVDLARSFTRLGISMRQLINMTPEQLLVAVARGAQEDAMAISDLNNVMGRNAAAEYSATLKDIAANGLPQVSKSAQEATDRLAKMNAQWATLIGKAKGAIAEKALSIGPGGGAIGGAAALGALGAKTGSVFGPWGTAIGGALGVAVGGVAGYKTGQASREAAAEAELRVVQDEIARQQTARARAEGLRQEREAQIRKVLDQYNTAIGEKRGQLAAMDTARTTPPVTAKDAIADLEQIIGRQNDEQRRILDELRTGKKVAPTEVAPRLARIGDNITVAAPQAADRLARIGGIIGGQADRNRGIFERQLKEQEIQRKVLEDIVKIQDQMLAKLAEMAGG